MSKFKDLTGMKFGRLTVIKRAENRGEHTYWNVKCDCGNTKNIERHSLISGHTTSCGCFQSETVIKYNTTHGLTQHRLHSVWVAMKKRCTNKNSNDYKYYGGRNITLCSEWESDFKCFYDWAMASGYSDKLTIDRANNDLGYCKENCRWATRKEQSRNTRSNRFLVLQGEKKCITDWAEILNIKSGTIFSRIRRGWTDIDALTKPIRNRVLKEEE